MSYGLAFYDDNGALTLSIDDSKLLVLHTQRINKNTGPGYVDIPTLDPAYARALVIGLEFRRMAKLPTYAITAGRVYWTAPTGGYAVDSQLIVVSK